MNDTLEKRVADAIEHNNFHNSNDDGDDEHYWPTCSNIGPYKGKHLYVVVIPEEVAGKLAKEELDNLCMPLELRVEEQFSETDWAGNAWERNPKEE